MQYDTVTFQFSIYITHYYESSTSSKHLLLTNQSTYTNKRDERGNYLTTNNFEKICERYNKLTLPPSKYRNVLVIVIYLVVAYNKWHGGAVTSHVTIKCFSGKIVET